MTSAAKVIILLLSSLFLSSLILNIYLLYQKSENNRVVRVIDGDSFETQDNRRIRLLSLDAPEKNRCLFTESRDYLKSLILSKKVYLKDTVIDDYGRILADVFIGKKLINKLILEKGYARFAYVKSPYYDELKNLSQTAKDNKIGIYSSSCRTANSNPDCQIKGNINHGEKFYFTPDCRNYKEVSIDESFGDKWFCTEIEAKGAGFTKASNC